MSSTEVTNETVTFDQKRFWRDSDGFVFADDYSVFNRLVNTLQIVRGDALPSFRTLIAKGLNATTPLSVLDERMDVQPTISRTVRRYSSPAGYSVVYNKEGRLFNLGFNPNSVSPLMESTAANQSLSNFYSNLQSVETKFKGLVFSGELRESLSMIRHPARSLRRKVSDYLDSLKRGSRVKRSRRLSFVRDTWLEASFGWRPLISDIDSAIHAFYSSEAIRPIFQMVRGRGRQIAVSNLGDGSVNTGYANLRYQIQDTLLAECRHYGVYRSEGNGERNLHAFGFSPSEFIPTLWELIPYSFLVDYFTNIGKILESWSYRSNGLSFLSQGTKTSSSREAINMRNEPDAGSSSYTIEVTGSTGSFRSHKTQLVRYPNAPHSVLTLELKVPGNWWQWINIAALSKQVSLTRTILRQ